jgi:hypothetical protein
MKWLSLPFFFVLIQLPALAWDNDQVDQAWRQHDISALEEMASDDNFAGLYSHYRIAAIALDQDNKKLAKKSLNIVLDRLEDNYQNADEAALYYNALGLSIALKPWTAAFIVNKADDALTFSEKQTPEHASTLVAKAIGLYNRPAFVGGDKDLAIKYFDQALGLYELEEAWGFEDAWLWKVKTLVDLGDTKAAFEQKEQLLQRFPDYIDAQQLTF